MDSQTQSYATLIQVHYMFPSILDCLCGSQAPASCPACTCPVSGWNNNSSILLKVVGHHGLRVWLVQRILWVYVAGHAHGLVAAVHKA